MVCNVFIYRLSTCFGMHIVQHFVDPSGILNVPLEIIGKIIHASTLVNIIGVWVIIHLKETADREVLGRGTEFESLATSRIRFA